MARAPKYYFAPPRENINMRVSNTVRKSVMFIGIRNDEGKIVYGGTAFVVSVPAPIDPGMSFTYVVTAKHVLEEIRKKIGDQSFVIRANKTDGTAVEFNADLTHWHFHPDDTVDAAVSIYAPPPNAGLDIHHIPLKNFLTEEDISTYAVGAGDEVFMTGLFTKAAGASQNMPVVRMGNIALMPQERIQHGDEPIDAYLIEGRSIGGLSGSPAFVSATIKVPTPNPAFPCYFAPGQTFFLGLVRGHWDVPPSIALLQAEKVNMGISIVVPAHKIREILYIPDMEAKRKEQEERIRREDESGVLDTSFTKSDFEDALYKATRKIEPPKTDKKKGE